ncbi:MAG: beta-lactamase family protein [Thermoleophilaceae bacterium]|nr:beta-lactamase family protein [Thermoleophilaceae bacterium]
MIRARFLGLIASAALLAAAPANALGDATTDALDDALADARADTYVPATTASVHRCGRVVWNGASGVRRLGSNVRVTPNTRFVIASVTKPITAAMILQLVDAGRLSLDSPVAAYEPGLPNARRITIRHLLSHTSGLPEYSPDDQIEELAERRPRHPFTRPEVLRTVGRPEARPGARYEYVWTDGGVVSTAPDLANFTDALFDGRLISPERLAEMTTMGKGGYGFGIYKRTEGGRRWTGHDGYSGSGYEAEAWHDRSRDVTVTVLSSSSDPEADDTNSSQIWSAVVRAYDRSPAERSPVC